MPSDSDDPLAQQLRQLRREYLRDSSARVDELHLLRARLDQEGPAALPDIRQAFHRLAGSGGSYGFPEVSSRSRDGEHLVVRLQALGTSPSAADLALLDAAIEGVAGAFLDAVKTFDSGQGS